MSRELNKEIFDSLFSERLESTEEHKKLLDSNTSVINFSNQEKTIADSIGYQGNIGLNPISETEKKFYPVSGPLEWERFSLQMTNMAKKIESLESQLKSTEIRMLEFVKASKKNFDKINARQQGLENSMREYNQQVSTKLSVLSGKVTEKVINDQKVQNLIDRHNTVVQSFETQMSQMKKMISQKEYELLSFKSRLR